MKAIQPHRSVLLLGSIFLVAYLWMQWHFFDLRILIDSGVRIFLIALEQFPDVTEQRTLLAMNQLLPAAFAQFGAPLKTIAITYVINDTVIYPFFFLLFLFYYKDRTSTVALIAGYFVAIKYHFFIIPYSVGLAWPLILWLFIIVRQHDYQIRLRSIHAPFVFGLIYLLVFAHPIVAVTTIFIGLHKLVNSEQRNPFRYFNWPILLFLFFMFVKWSDPDPHDMGNVLSIGGKQMGANIANLKYQLLLPAYYPITALAWLSMILLLFNWLRQKQWRKLYVPLIALSFTMGVYVLYGIYLDYTLGHWMVKTLTPATLLFIFVIVQHIKTLPKPTAARIEAITALMLVPLVLWEFTIIAKGVAPTFGQRKEVIQNIVEAIPDDSTSKFYFDTRNAPDGSFYPLITTSEIAIISELYYNKQVTPNLVPITDQNDWLADSLKSDQFYVNLHSFKQCGEFPPYFTIVPGAYKQLELDSLWQQK